MKLGIIKAAGIASGLEFPALNFNWFGKDIA
jgi:hypothetical protein